MPLALGEHASRKLQPGRGWGSSGMHDRRVLLAASSAVTFAIGVALNGGASRPVAEDVDRRLADERTGQVEA